VKALRAAPESRCAGGAASRLHTDTTTRLEAFMSKVPRRLAGALLMMLATPLVQAQDANLGRNLAATCANCHGTNGRALGDTVKPLAGVSADKIVAMLNDYKSGAQPATIMHQLAKGFTDEQIRLIAAFFAAQRGQ
jgi:cytochrome c553